MKKSALVGASLLAIVTSSAFAQGGGGMGPSHWPPASTPSADIKPLTRAEVKADIVKAQQDGTLAADNRVDYPAAHVARADSVQSRADVQATARLATNAEVASTYRGN